LTIDLALGDSGLLARVRQLTDDPRRVFLEFASGGRLAPATFEEPVDFKPGDTLVVIDIDGHQRAEAVPRSLWPDDPEVGIVRLRLPDVTVVSDGNSRLRRLPPTSTEYAEGNTVEFSDLSGVSRVLSEQPIRSFDVTPLESDVVKHFKRPKPDPPLTFDDFGGLDLVVARARELVTTGLAKRRELRAMNVTPVKGVLFTGEPGTGKTLLARIIASQTDAVLYEISGPEVFSKYYGQSEDLLRRIFDAAAAEPSAIVFFDEIDSVAGRRGEESHEASKRVVAQLLTLMDDSQSEALVIATTNRRGDIDPALRRPGRLDWEIHFPLPGESDRETILRRLARPKAIEGSLPFALIAAHTGGWTGAELNAIYTEAGHLSVADDRVAIHAEDVLGGFERVRLQRAEKRPQRRRTKPL
jgi:transitional endoplasmic reticulum ATPase